MERLASLSEKEWRESSALQGGPEFRAYSARTNGYASDPIPRRLLVIVERGRSRARHPKLTRLPRGHRGKRRNPLRFSYR
jgi:hypothetical protein